MTELVFASSKEYADHRGVDVSLINRWKRAGRLVLDETGRIVVHASDAKLAVSLHPTRGGRQASASKENGRATAARASASAPERKDDTIDLAVEVAREKRAKADLAELELAAKRRELVARADVDSLVRGLAIAARESLLALPGRLAPELALLSDVAAIEQQLTDELLLVCQTMHSGITDAEVLRTVDESLASTAASDGNEQNAGLAG